MCCHKALCKFPLKSKKAPNKPKGAYGKVKENPPHKKEKVLWLPLEKKNWAPQYI